MTAPTEKLRVTLSRIRLMNGEITEEGNRVIRIGLYGVKEIWTRVSGSGAGALYEKNGEG